MIFIIITVIEYSVVKSVSPNQIKLFRWIYLVFLYIINLWTKWNNGRARMSKTYHLTGVRVCNN